jgi:hypothetical protein
MKAVFCTNSFQDWTYKNNGLKFFTTPGDLSVDYRKITYAVANYLMQSNGIETVFFKNNNFKDFEDIKFNSVVDIPYFYETTMSPHVYFAGLKILCFASIKDSFIFNNGNTLLTKNESLFKKEILNNKYQFVLSFQKAEPEENFNKKLLEFWHPILPKSFNYSSDSEYKSYDLSFFVCNDFALVNSVAAEIYEFLMENATKITGIYSTQLSSSDFNPEISYVIENILFPNMLLDRAKNLHLIACPDQQFKKSCSVINEKIKIFKNLNFTPDVASAVEDKVAHFLEGDFGFKIKNVYHIQDWVSEIKTYYDLNISK